jgi:hypothetical protein
MPSQVTCLIRSSEAGHRGPLKRYQPPEPASDQDQTHRVGDVPSLSSGPGRAVNQAERAPPHAVDAALKAYRDEGRRLAATERGVDLAEGASTGCRCPQTKPADPLDLSHLLIVVRNRGNQPYRPIWLQPVGLRRYAGQACLIRAPRVTI